ncbi:hypothetical protein KA047_02695 [Candidatus Saccharibacteria bacterium]|nr:hypothetical protein [Candidatus Saccharibacteria bacterium]
MKSQDSLTRLTNWKHSRIGYGLSSIIEGALAFAAATWAIDSGSMWAYLLATIFTVGSINNLYKAIVFKSK